MEENMKFKYIFLFAAMFVIIIFAYFIFFSEDKIQPTVYTFSAIEINTPTNTQFQLDLVDSEFRVEPMDASSSSSEAEYGKQETYYEIYYNSKLAGTLTVEEKKLKETRDYYYFLSYKPILNLEQPLGLRASVRSNNKQISNRYISYPEHEKKVAEGAISADTPPTLQDGVLHKPFLLEKNTKLPAHSLYLDGDDFNLHLNRVNIYEPLENGVRKAYDQLSPNFFYRQTNGEAYSHHFEISLPHLAGKEIEHWGLVGQSGMFAWENEEQKELYLLANLDRVRKWTQGGFQYITPTSYYPYDPNGYWVVPAQHVGNRLLLAGKDRFSTNIALLSLDAALDTQTKEGMWVTQPRSEWLYNDYGIEAGFYDTRFSTDAGLFLINGYREFRESNYLEGARRYADFLVDFARTHHYETKNGGYLVYDYRDGVADEYKKETHVSLNHLVTEMNFLYEVYKETKDKETQNEEYLHTAEKMRIAVQDTRDYWKKEENGDLWYAFMPDGSYDLLDYPLLTLKDLRYSQELIMEIHGELDPDFQYLIEVKKEYLREQGLPLYD